MTKKIQSVLDLAKYHVGDTLWWVTLRPKEAKPTLEEDDEWIENYHPKVLFDRKFYRHCWPRKKILPRLHFMDFQYVISLLTSTLLVEQFIICNLTRSTDTGEFFYANQSDEWMPEEYLFESQENANRELKRIQRMVAHWSKE